MAMFVYRRVGGPPCKVVLVSGLQLFSQGDALKCLEVSSSLALTKYPELQEVRFGVHKVGPKWPKNQL